MEKQYNLDFMKEILNANISNIDDIKIIYDLYKIDQETAKKTIEFYKYNVNIIEDIKLYYTELSNIGYLKDNNSSCKNKFNKEINKKFIKINSYLFEEFNIEYELSKNTLYNSIILEYICNNKFLNGNYNISLFTVNNIKKYSFLILQLLVKHNLALSDYEKMYKNYENSDDYLLSISIISDLYFIKFYNTYKKDIDKYKGLKNILSQLNIKTLIRIDNAKKDNIQLLKYYGYYINKKKLNINIGKLFDGEYMNAIILGLRKGIENEILMLI